MSTTQNETEPLNASTRFVRFTDSVSRLTGSSFATVVAAGAMLVCCCCRVRCSISPTRGSSW